MLSLKPKQPLRTASMTVSTIKGLTLIFLVFSFFSFAFDIAARYPVTGVITQLLFSEGTGTTTADGSGNAHTGTLVNGPTWVAGKYGQAINFDGTNDYVNIPDHNDYTLDPALSYTWSGWIKNNSFKEWSTVWSQTLNSSNFFYFYAHTSTDADGGPVTNGISVYWWVNNGASKLGAHSSNNVLTLGQWSYVAVTYDASKAQNNRFTIYVNGVDVTVRTDVSSVGTITTINPANIRVGSNQAFGEYLNGAVDEVRYYRRLLSQAEIVTDMNTGAAADTQLPTVSVTAPVSGTIVSGVATINATAADNVGVSGVQFLLDGVNLGAEDLTSPYSISWSTTSATAGAHVLTARARDAAGNVKVSAPVNVTVNNADTQVPAVSVSAPLAGASVSGTSTITATATDNIGVAGVQFLLDGVNLGAEDIAAPYSISWNTTTVANGSHLLTAKARDAAGNSTLSTTVTVTVNNPDVQPPAVTLSAPAAGSTLSGTTNLTATATDNIGVAAVQFFLDGVALGAEDPGSPFSIAWNTITTANGQHSLTASARDIAGNSTVSAPVSVTVNNDLEAPVLNITNPATNDILIGTVTITVAANDNFGVSGVQFLLDGVALGSEDILAPFSISWNTGTVANGAHVLTARARDAAGNTTLSDPVTVTVNNDIESPVITITDPVAGATLAGTINISADASDNAGVAGVQFFIDGINAGVEVLTTPYSTTINTTTLTEGNHLITARARDAAGNSVTSAPVTIRVQNIQPDLELPSVSILSPGINLSLSGITTVTADANDNVAVAGVQFLLDGANLGLEVLSPPYSVSWNTGTVTNGNHIITAKARDAAGNVKISDEIPVIVDNDILAPSISITNPAAGNVNGVVNIAADASDNLGVAGVQFLLDGNVFGEELLTPPFTIAWNTTLLANGVHIISAKARDAAGNSATTTGVSVTINNADTGLPVVSLTAPAAGNVSGVTNITANASDNVGVAGVQFLLDGINLGAEDLASPYSLPWNTGSINNGTHTLSARARDAAGNTNISAGVTVTINNDVQLPSISISSPVSGATVSATINVAANASDNVGIAGVQFLLNGVALGTEDVSSPYSVSWNSTTVANGNFTITAVARDAAGNVATSTPVSVTVNNNLNLISAHPFNENTGVIANDITGNSHTGTLTNGPTWVAGKYGQAINLDGTNDYVNIPDHADYTLNPAQNYTWSGWVKNNSFKEWSTVWSQTLNTSNFFYFYAHTSTDPDGGPVTNGISVYWWVNNGASKIGAHSSNNVLTLGQWSYVAVTYDASKAQNNRFTIYVNGIDVTVRTDVSSVGTITAIDPTNIRIGSNQAFGEYLNGAVDEVRYYRRLLTAAEIVTDMNTPLGADNTVPVVNVSSPVTGSSVSATVNVTAAASDNVGVAGVQFLLDGTSLGAEDLTSPYSVSWNTTTIANGIHTLTARARDAAGNTSNSATVTITVNNVVDTEAPVATITAPLAGTVTGTILLAANATDNTGVAGVQFLIDGVNFGSEDLTSPYSISWPTASATNGNHTITAVARDAAGNLSIAAGVIVTINNLPDTQLPVVSISNPAAGNVVGIVSVTATATDNVAVAGVQLLLDGNLLGAEILSAPYSYQWNTGLSANGVHLLSARARDAAGNMSTSPAISVTIVPGNPPVLSGISALSITSGSAIINWTSNVPSSSQVNYGVSASYGLFTLVDPILVSSHSQILNGLLPATLYHYQVLSTDVNGIRSVSGDLTFTTASMSASLGTLNTHSVLADNTGKIIPWTPNPVLGYDSVMRLAWNYLLNSVPNDPATGKPAYYSQSYVDPNTQQMANWPHNPAGLYGMIAEAAMKYYGYSGNTAVMTLAENVALWHLDHGMTISSDSWPLVPYASGDAGSLNYGGASKGNTSGVGDGVGYLQPDKIGELGLAWLKLYKYDGNIRFRDAAIQAGNILSSKVRAGTVSASPWPFRVNAHTGAIREDYTSNVIGPISLLDGLIASGLGNTAAYQAARTIAWNWMMTYPMQNNIWSQYFEDVAIQNEYNNNRNQYNAMMTARYLLEHPEFDANWETHVRGLITWVETTFGQTSFGATTIREQQLFFYAMGSHTSRYASVNALLFEKTGDLAAKEKAYRAFNWATYMARTTGVILDGPEVNNEWFTDGYADYVRHFMTGVAAVPEWTPPNQTHLLRTTSVIKNVTYGANSLSYTTYDANATEVLHVSFTPVNVMADGVPLAKRSDLSQPGWTLDVATKTMKIYHTTGTVITINANPPARLLNAVDPMYTFQHRHEFFHNSAVFRRKTLQLSENPD